MVSTIGVFVFAVFTTGNFFTIAGLAAGFFALAALTLVAVFDVFDLTDDLVASLRNGLLEAFFTADFLATFFTLVFFVAVLVVADLRFVAAFFATTAFAFKRDGIARAALAAVFFTAFFATFVFATFFFATFPAAPFAAFFNAVFFTAARFIAIPRQSMSAPRIRTGAGHGVTTLSFTQLKRILADAREMGDRSLRSALHR